ncbi:MAG: hypothetical protein WKF30_02480 [Pyrinomonadaceae bacterium]
MPSSPVTLLQSIYYPATNTGYWFDNSYSNYGMLTSVKEQRGMAFTGPEPIPQFQGSTSQGSITNSGTTSRSIDYNFLTSGTLSDAPTFDTSTEDWEGKDTAAAVTSYEVFQNTSPRTTTVTRPDGTKSIQYSYNYSSLAATHPDKFKDGLIYNG